MDTRIDIARHGHDRRRPRSRARTYAWLGALLGQGAPAGALVVELLVRGGSPLALLGEHGLLYAYMSLSTGLAFAIFGHRLGSTADHLLHQRRALRRANHRLRWLSEVDPLTGVLNRRALQARLKGELKRAQRDGTPLALLMLDLDHFKRVNDAFGHIAGDGVLRRVGRHLRRLARATDSVGRIGGEEFLAVLPATGIAEARSSAERLRISIGTAPANASTPAVTVSIGVLVLVDPDPAEMDGGLALVDAALYRAKAEGRDRVWVSAESRDGRPRGT